MRYVLIIVYVSGIYDVGVLRVYAYIPYKALLLSYLGVIQKRPLEGPFCRNGPPGSFRQYAPFAGFSPLWPVFPSGGCSEAGALPVQGALGDH